MKYIFCAGLWVLSLKQLVHEKEALSFEGKVAKASEDGAREMVTERADSGALNCERPCGLAVECHTSWNLENRPSTRPARWSRLQAAATVKDLSSYIKE